ncbi:cobaltochelatase subunit CobN [Trichothermofontia sp.]
MHRLATLPGGWTPETEGVIFVEQTPAPIVLLTAADTEIQTLAQVITQLPPDFPALRVANLLQLQQQLTIDTYAETVLAQAQVIVLRLLGGRAYWSYGLEVVREVVATTGARLFVLPGDDQPDPDLMSHATVGLRECDRLWRYFNEGGVTNLGYALRFLAWLGLGYGEEPPLAQSVPRVGVFDWRGGHLQGAETPKTPGDTGTRSDLQLPRVGILFYRAHYLAGNTAPIAALCQALCDRQLEPIPVFVPSLREPDVQADVLTYCQPENGEPIQVLVNTTSFASTPFAAQGSPTLTSPLSPLASLDVPVIQVILGSGTLEQWESQQRGLSPRDLAMNVALPEVDGRIISRAISFKAVQSRHQALETEVVVYAPVPDRVQWVAELAANWVRLRQTPVSDRRVALILANYPTRDARLANGVGLDTPASCVEILKALQQEGYTLPADLPQTGDDLMQRLTAGVTNDPEGQGLRSLAHALEWETFVAYFAQLPEAVRQGVMARWGDKDPNTKTAEADFPGLQNLRGLLPIPGIQLGNIFIGIQPARGYDVDPSLNYHAPDLEPTPAYLAFYLWVRQVFGAQAIVHVGKHGNLEWLPGKGVALSVNCYPEVALGPLPHLYPFIVNDPGEGTQAKRRSQAVILDHLTPPLTRAELYGPLQMLEALIDEYYEAQNLNPSRLPVIRDRIFALVQQENLDRDLGGLASGEAESVCFDRLDGYLCELKEAQIRDGLHILGQCPQGRQMRDLIIAIARYPSAGRLGLTRAIAQAWGLTLDPWTGEMAERLSPEDQECLAQQGYGDCRTVGDAIAVLEGFAALLIDQLLDQQRLDHQQRLDQRLDNSGEPQKHRDLKENTKDPASVWWDGRPICQAFGAELITQELAWIRTGLLPALQQTDREITNLLRGLNGQFVPSGPAGAPTRGRSEVLPTGRNFYSVDLRGLPTETAWLVGKQAAEALIERYTQDNGEYPKTLGLSIWGTSTMRTGGDDIAEALALLGVRPVWEGPSRRVVDFEILPLSSLGRPRVDVMLRISGFFRDAFPNLIDLFDRAVQAVAALDEPADQNPLAAQVKQDSQYWQALGLSAQQAQIRASYRIFGSKPGAYGAGLQGLIDAQNWTDEADLARAYMNWSSYAYGSRPGDRDGIAAPEAFTQRLGQLQIVLHNQDNREHDLLDSDDYYQFQGGLMVAARVTQRQAAAQKQAIPAVQAYFGDHARPEKPKVRPLREELLRVYRSRVINPKWIAGAMRHGYKGAFEMAATVDYLFAYDATTHCVEPFMYQGVAEAYLLDPNVQAFVATKNPHALRDMAERLLEAVQRGLWTDAPAEMLDPLRAIVLQAEAAIEGQSLQDSFPLDRGGLQNL